MGHYIENATTRKYHVLVYSGSEMLVLTDLSGSGIPNQKYVGYNATQAIRNFVTRRRKYRQGLRYWI